VVLLCSGSELVLVLLYLLDMWDKVFVDELLVDWLFRELWFPEYAEVMCGLLCRSWRSAVDVGYVDCIVLLLFVCPFGCPGL
jgi:hypothetical protein